MVRWLLVWIMGFALAYVNQSCNVKKGLPTDERPIHGKGSNFITKNLEEHQNDFEWFSAKIATKVELRGEKNSFKTSVRIRKDSVIWLQITFSNILIAQTIITPDSVKVVLKREKKYFFKDIDFLSREFGVDMSYQLLQDLIVGNVVGYDQKEKYKAPEDSLYYRLTTHKEKRINKYIEKDKVPRKEEKQLFIQYWLHPANFKMMHLMIEDLADTNLLSVQNRNYILQDERLHPEFIELFGKSPLDSVRAGLEFSKITWNEKQEFPFNIGENYERID
jgi:hypothetical protein